MQSNRSLRRKVKKELDLINVLYSNDESEITSKTQPTSDFIYIQSTSIIQKDKAIDVHNNSHNEIIDNLSSPNIIQDNHDLSNKVQNHQDSNSFHPESRENYSFKDNLCRWVVECNVPQTTVNKLLHLMKQQEIINTKELPWDSRTLLATPHSTISSIRIVEPGRYYHFGLAAGIIRYATPDLTKIKIMIGIDGFPIAKSSNSQLWPILACIDNTTKIVFPVGIYHGYAKPKDSNDLLIDFILEAKYLACNGIVIDDCVKKVSFSAFICDSPAKAFVLKLKGHSGFSSCTRCIQVGEYYKNRVCFPYCSPLST